MRSRIHLPVFKLIITALILVHCALYGQEKVLIEDVELPSGWSIKKSVTASEEQLKALSGRLGFEMVRVVNYLVDAKGIGLQVKIAECKTEQDAKNLYNLVSSAQKTNINRFLQKGKIFFEFASNSSEMIKTARSLFKLKKPIHFEADKIVTWEVNFSVAPIESGDYMAFNDLFNLLIRYSNGAENSEIKSSIKRLSNRFKFSETISLRNESPPWGAPEYHINSAKVLEKKADVIVYRIEEPEYDLGMPLLSILAKIPVKPFKSYKPDTPVDFKSLTESNIHWPKNNKKIVNVITNIVKEGMTIDQKVDVIHQWVFKNVKHGGERIGTRYGVDKVLEQGFGRCWDICDVFVTLCRAAGIPSRQIMGWIYQKAGHTWAQVYIPEKGWISIDPTTPFKGISGDYIPFFVSEDGELPAVYWNIPEIHKISNDITERECVLDRKVNIIDSLILDVPEVPSLCEDFEGIKKRIDIGGCELYVEIEGEGMPVVLLHGGPGSTHHEFHPYFSDAANFAKVIYYDQRGCGLSDYEKGSGYSFIQAVEDLEKLRRKLNIEKWVVLGHSYGGLLAQCYSIKYPEHTAGLVLVCSMPGMDVELGKSREDEFLSEEEKKKIFQLKMNYFAKNITVKQLIYNAFLNGDWKRQHFYKPTKEEIARAAHYNWVHDQGFNNIMSQSTEQIDLTGAFKDCPIPTLIIEGKWDLTWNEQKPQILNKNHPNAKMVIFERSSHSPFVEEQKKFFDELEGFIVDLKEIEKDKISEWKNYVNKLSIF